MVYKFRCILSLDLMTNVRLFVTMRFRNTIKNDFFGICIPLAYYFCVLPPAILGDRSKRFRSAYSVYTATVYLGAIFCHLSQLIKLYQIVMGDPFIFEELVRNYIITLYHFTALVKCVFLRGELSGNIFEKIIRHEENLYERNEEGIKAIYVSTLSSVRRTKRYYLAGIAVVVVFYIAAPAFRDPYYIRQGNETIVIPQVPLSSWTLVDDKYWYAFVWTSAAGAYLTIFLVCSDLICYSFFAFGVGRLEILCHYISHFHENARLMQEKRQVTRTQAFRVLQREYITMHQDIISYVKELNDGLKKLMLLDFLPSSLQLAGLIYQMMKNLSIIQCVLLGQFIFTFIARIFIYCNSAQNLSARSQEVATAWYELDWTELPQEIRRSMVLCMMRAQEPLRITIGDFQDISLATFLAILKGTYSYMMLLTTV